MEINWYEVFIQCIGIIGIIAGLSAFQCNKHSHALALKMTEEGAFGLQYFLLGGYTGAVLNLVGIFRNLIFTYLGKRDMQKELKYGQMLTASAQLTLVKCRIQSILKRFHLRRLQKWPISERRCFTRLQLSRL